MGIILINTGTPTTPSYWGVRTYLREFLSDPRVIDIPFIARFLLLHCIILPFRSWRSAKAYRQIWTSDGSPLLSNSLQFAHSLQEELGGKYVVACGMRYGQPSITQAWQKLKGCTELVVLPLFPHYASSSWGSAVAKIMSLLEKEDSIPNLRTIAPFYAHPDFIRVLAQDIQAHKAYTTSEHIVFSFHGLPEHHIQKSGCRLECSTQSCSRLQEAPFCYRAQCFATAEALAVKMQRKPGTYSIAFQSRLGRRPWIKPYFDELLVELRKQGIRRLVVVCPSFVADCLETIEEIAIRAREQWLGLGGEDLSLIPCLNVNPDWVVVAANLIRAEIHQKNLTS